MTDRQGLVPDNLPYGERQNSVAAMRQAGVPLSPTQGGPNGQSPGAPARQTAGPTRAGGQPVDGPMGLLSRTTPADFPFLTDPANQTPDVQPESQPDSPIQALAQSSQSTFGAAVLQRLAGR